MKSVYLSPSTQEGNLGVGGYGTEEKYANIVCDKVAMILVNRDILFHRNYPSMTLLEVIADSNSHEPALHLAIHTNSGGGRGCEVFVHTFASPALGFAEILYNKISAITPTADRGIKEGIHHLAGGKPLAELAYTRAPACLVEIAFHDNKDDAAWLLSHTDQIASAIADSILEYFDVPTFTEDLEVINAALEKAGARALHVPYWQKNAIPGGTCDGGYVALAFKRIAEALK